MAINGSATANTIVWEQTVAVSAGTDYYFSAWVSSWIPRLPRPTSIQHQQCAPERAFLGPAGDRRLGRIRRCVELRCQHLSQNLRRELEHSVWW